LIFCSTYFTKKEIFIKTALNSVKIPTLDNFLSNNSQVFISDADIELEDAVLNKFDISNNFFKIQ
jgi:hypothetical protein